MWKLLFDECDLTKSGHLNIREFNRWADVVLQRKDFKGFEDAEFEQICEKNGANPEIGLPWSVISDTFTKNQDTIDSLKSQQNLAEIAGIPSKKINGKLIEDLQNFVFEDHNVKKVEKSANGKRICVEFGYDVNDGDLKSIEAEMADLFASTDYGKKVKFVRPSASGDDSDEKDDVTEKIVITLEPFDASNEHIMIFLNGQRVRYSPAELTHGDHILFGSHHLFQFINPAEAGVAANSNTPAKDTATLTSELSKQWCFCFCYLSFYV